MNSRSTQKIVTIAIAVYNVEKYIEKCIVSALSQDFDDYEVLVVDDKGKDESIDVVERLAQTYPHGDRIRIVRHEKNTGTGGVRNTCIKEAQGEYLLFMDGDDYLSPHSVRLLYDAMIANDADIVMGNHQRVTVDGQVLSTSDYQPGITESEYAIARWMNANHTNYYPVATWNKLFKTSFLRDNGFECVPWHRQEDIYFALQTSFFVKKIVTIPDVTYFWVQIDGSCVHSEVSEWHLKQYIDIFDRCLALYDEKRGNGLRSYPKELIWIITNRYLWGFITLNTFDSTLLSKQQKNDFLKHLKAITHHIRFREEFNGDQKLIYTVIQSPYPYLSMRWALKARRLYRRIIRKLVAIKHKIVSK